MDPTANSRRRSLTPLLLVVLVVVLVGLSYKIFWSRGPDSLTVYCAHDSVYSESVLRDFEQRSGIPVAIRFDTEATKSLGLVELLIAEKDRPRCDVFWNNELFGTVQLQDAGVLAPYKGPGFARVPDAMKHPDGYWAGFGARLRVYIVNTDLMECSEEAIRDALAGDLKQVAIARPLYGTTLTHYAVLADRMGMDGLQAWHEDCRRRGIVEATGNAHVKNLVAQGNSALGYTDTDDFFVAKDEGAPVDALPVRTEDGRTICIPNTVAIINGTRNLRGARLLVDYLLSAECEARLAASRARQVPLGPVDGDQLSAEVAELTDWAADAVPLTGLWPARNACLVWLKQEARP